MAIKHNRATHLLVYGSSPVYLKVFGCRWKFWVVQIEPKKGDLQGCRQEGPIAISYDGATWWSPTRRSGGKRSTAPLIQDYVDGN